MLNINCSIMALTAGEEKGIIPKSNTRIERSSELCSRSVLGQSNITGRRTDITHLFAGPRS